MAHRIFNFNAGPSTLPLDVLKKMQDEATIEIKDPAYELEE